MEGEFDTGEIAGTELTTELVQANSFAQRDIPLEPLVARHGSHKLHI